MTQDFVIIAVAGFIGRIVVAGLALNTLVIYACRRMTMNERDKIKLARAMGAQFHTISNGSWAQINLPNGRTLAEWNPDTDANDDYGVLEWLRKQYDDGNQETNKAFRELTDAMLYYEIGDFTRSALKVLD